MKTIAYKERKSLLYKTGVEYGDYSLNHVEGCSHGCLYPCYAMMMAKRFGKIESYDDWRSPKIIENALDLLKEEIQKYRKKIGSVHLCFSTDPFMYGHKEIEELSLKLISTLNEQDIKCTVLTKGILPPELASLSKRNEYGITLVSLHEKFRKKYEPYAAECGERIASLDYLNTKGFKTWVSIEPYPTPNIAKQDFQTILDAVSFVDKIIFGRLNYNRKVNQFRGYQEYYDALSTAVVDFCKRNGKEYYIKKGTTKLFSSVS
jgi:DNA repair photolyase